MARRMSASAPSHLTATAALVRPRYTKAEPESGMVRACPFLLVGMCRIHCSTDTSRHRMFKISPRRIAVSRASLTK
jgi:hypothetical protein